MQLLLVVAVAMATHVRMDLFPVVLLPLVLLPLVLFLAPQVGTTQVMAIQGRKDRVRVRMRHRHSRHHHHQ